jgi:hypothetical protein
LQELEQVDVQDNSDLQVIKEVDLEDEEQAKRNERLK